MENIEKRGGLDIEDEQVFEGIEVNDGNGEIEIENESEEEGECEG